MFCRVTVLLCVALSQLVLVLMQGLIPLPIERRLFWCPLPQIVCLQCCPECLCSVLISFDLNALFVPWMESKGEALTCYNRFVFLRTCPGMKSYQKGEFQVSWSRTPWNRALLTCCTLCALDTALKWYREHCLHTTRSMRFGLNFSIRWRGEGRSPGVRHRIASP